MDKRVSIKSLHLEYRLWIAELNYDINLLRIFNDRLTEIAGSKGQNQQEAVSGFEKKFSECRQAIDDLRHRMHIEKMNLAAESRKNATEDAFIPTPEQYAGLRDDFFAYRIRFKETKTEFLRFENQVG
ncbi:MAG TPA: hypothetical protein VG870_05635 [Chitinophagaceae bacterium]|nr:hypothetical protein [Chitinophagaceae bacterium]